MRPRLALLLALSCTVSLSACDEGTSENARLVQIVDEQGLNPVGSSGEIRIVIDQLDAAPRQTITGEIRGGTFDIPVTIASYVVPTRISVEIESDEGDLQIGAVPSFIPFYVGFSRVVVGAPLSCAELEGPQLPSERLDLALVAQGATLWVIGGTRGGESTDIPLSISAAQLTWPDAIVDPTTIADFEFEPFSRGLHEAQAIPLGDTGRIVVLSRSHAFVWRAGEAEQMIPLGDHPGAGSGSTLVSLGGDGVAIVGGGEGDEGSALITWVDAAGATTRTGLAVARRNPAAAFVGGVLVIAGGQAEGEALFEVAPLRGAGAVLDPTRTGARARPILLRDPQRRTAALLGGRDAAGDLVGEVLLVTGCPACAITALPAENDWPTPRESPAVVETAEGTWLLGGVDTGGVASAAADRVTVTNVATSIHELSLDVPRARGAAAQVAQGVVVLAGGLDSADRRVDSLTICWPRELEPMD